MLAYCYVQFSQAALKCEDRRLQPNSAEYLACLAPQNRSMKSVSFRIQTPLQPITLCRRKTPANQIHAAVVMPTCLLRLSILNERLKMNTPDFNCTII